MEEKIVLTPEEAITAIQNNYPTSGYQVLCAALDMAMRELGKQVVKPLIRERYEPARCPTCGYGGFSEHMGDGYYRHRDHMDICEDCGQRVSWPDHVSPSRVVQYPQREE